MAIAIDQNKIVIIPAETIVELGIAVSSNPGTIITIDTVPKAGEIRKADGTVLAIGDVITEAELAGLVYAAGAANDFAATAFTYTIAGGGMNASGSVNILPPKGVPMGYFIADDGINGRELHRIHADGATELVIDFNPGVDDGFPVIQTVYDGFIYISGLNAGGDRTVFRIGPDGTVENIDASLPPELDGAEFAFNGLAQINGAIIVPVTVANVDGDPFLDTQLLRLNADGTLEGLTDAGGFPLSDVRYLTVFNGEYYFTANTAASGEELYKLAPDGSVQFVADMNPGAGDSRASGEPQGEFNGSFYFSAETDAGGEALYRITAAGAIELVSDLRADAGDSYIQEFLEFNSMLYFRADNGVTGSELYRVDAANTVALVSDIRPGVIGSSPDQLTVFNGALYFTATLADGRREVIRLNVDDTINVLSNIRGGSSGSNPSDFFAFGDDLYFTAVDSQANRRVYRIDEDDTIDTLLYVGPGGTEFSVFNDDVYFRASEDSGSPDHVGLELYRVLPDGTVELAADVYAGFQDSNPSLITSFAQTPLDGGAGNDIIFGSAVKDTINGFGGNDRLSGLAGDDIINGGDGDDIIIGGAGADTLDGGGGVDTLDYSGSDGGVIVSLTPAAPSSSEERAFAASPPAMGGHAEGDIVSNFENITGSDHNDSLTGSSGANRIVGGAGDDFIMGLAGADTLIGGAGTDTLNYSGSDAGVTIDLGANTASGGHADGDVISGFENVAGSGFNDSLFGSAGANRIEGGEGDDLIVGGDGADTLEGGGGNDLIFTGPGADSADAGAGDDQIYIQGGEASITGGSGFDYVVYDVYDGSALTFNLLGTGIEGVVGRDGADVLLANGMSGAVALYGNGGADILVGGSGGDTLDGGDATGLTGFTAMAARILCLPALAMTS